MRFTLPIRAGATATGAHSVTLDMGDYRSGGTVPNALKLDWTQQHCDGTLASMVLEHSADQGSTWVTLWDLGNTNGADKECYLYTWSRYLRATYTYAQGTSTVDPGLRFKFTLEPFGQPGWSLIKLYRSEHTDALMPILTDSARGFTAGWKGQADMAKRTIYTVLKGKGIEPDDLITDGHKDEPIVEGIADAGAALTLYNALLGSNAVKSDVYEKTLAALWDRYTYALGLATEGRVLNADTGDGAPEATEAVFRPARIII